MNYTSHTSQLDGLSAFKLCAVQEACHRVFPVIGCLKLIERVLMWLVSLLRKRLPFCGCCGIRTMPSMSALLHCPRYLVIAAQSAPAAGYAVSRKSTCKDVDVVFRCLGAVAFLSTAIFAEGVLAGLEWRAHNGRHRRRGTFSSVFISLKPCSPHMRLRPGFH
jgi:hypothetical protein